jgi:putative SOS response-associated peptidase YedK
MRWGLISHWAKDAKTAYQMINARVETLMQRAAFRGLLSHHRALEPAYGSSWSSVDNARLRGIQQRRSCSSSD